MTREQMRRFISSLKIMRNGATDDQALVSPDVYPAWREDRAYVVGDRVLYNGVLYKCLIAHEAQPTWTPADSPSLWALVHREIEDWVQPLTSEDAYHIGDKVRHNGSIWESFLDNNVWEPGIYGWEEVDGT